MVNKSLFASMLGRLPKANAVNEAGGLAYKLEPKHALAQIAATGTFGNAFYSTAETQLDEVLKLIDEVDDNQYLAKLALRGPTARKAVWLFCFSPEGDTSLPVCVSHRTAFFPSD